MNAESQLTITLIQMDCRLGQPAENFARATEFISEAARRGSKLVVLPELWSTAYDLEHASTHASILAHTHGIWLCGSLLEARDGQFYNCMPVYTPNGVLKAVYRKIHLFHLMQEEQFLAPGQITTLADLPWGKTGLAICYDLRFPELFRCYALQGAQLIVIPAEWPHPRREHWRTLLRARAIENQCFVVACNRVGSSKGSDFFGASGVIDPWGDTVIEGGETETLLTVTIDLSHVESIRRHIPVFADRRPELY